MKTIALALTLLACGTTVSVNAASIDGIRTLPSVQGEAGRPQIWLYRRGDKQVWILGSVTTIPRNTAFDASEIARKISDSSTVVGAPGQAIGENIGLFRALTLWGSVHKEKFNKGDARLSDLLPAATYAHWQSLKSKLLGSNDGTERLRPMYAAYELFKAASKQMDFSDISPASAAVRDTARKLGRDVVDGRFHLPVSDARVTVAAFEVSRADDIACLERTMTAIDELLPNVLRLRDAWATGDMPTLEESTKHDTTVNYCWAMLTNQAIAKNEGVSDLQSAMDQSWLQAVNTALTKGNSVFTVLPAADLIAGRGPAALLLRDGFVLEEPAEISRLPSR